ncbi:hypothetical protein AB0B45_36390 [Nonomuraea sp. NPDC049152]|uniref:hypothetical protein n=1 Tax=Nonomuraea sp. NPDC049152 TaxID=3154350 RepID=UPI0033DC5B1A
MPALRQLLIGYPAGVAGAFTVIDDEGLHFGLHLNLNAPPSCTEGYVRRRRDPRDTRVERARLDTYCKAPRDSETGVRGARNAPEPLPTPSIPGLEEWVERYDPAIWQALLTPPGR